MKIFAGHSVDVAVAFINANNNPAEVQGEITWSSSDPTVVGVSAKEGHPEQATITAGPSAGSAVIRASADADLGEGVDLVSAELEVVVVARGEAIGGEITPVGAGPSPEPR